MSFLCEFDLLINRFGFNVDINKKSGGFCIINIYASTPSAGTPQKDFAKDDMSYDEARRFVIYARYAPQRMLSLPEPLTEGPETLSFYHYARGEAFAALGDAGSLAMEAGKISGDDRTK